MHHFAKYLSLQLNYIFKTGEFVITIDEPKPKKSLFLGIISNWSAKFYFFFNQKQKLSSLDAIDSSIDDCILCFREQIIVCRRPRWVHPLIQWFGPSEIFIIIPLTHNRTTRFEFQLLIQSHDSLSRGSWYDVINRETTTIVLFLFTERICENIGSPINKNVLKNKYKSSTWKNDANSYRKRFDRSRRNDHLR